MFKSNSLFNLPVRPVFQPSTPRVTGLPASASGVLTNRIWRRLTVAIFLLVLIPIFSGAANGYADSPGFSGKAAKAPEQVSLSGKMLTVNWTKEAQGWRITELKAGAKPVESPSGLYTVLYRQHQPSGPRVDQDIEGRAFSFFPETVEKAADGSLIFRQELPVGQLEARWRIDPDFPTDLKVDLKFTAGMQGFFSLASPTLRVVKPENLDWGMVPGAWYGKELRENTDLAVRYSQGLPAVPSLARENSTMTLSPLIRDKAGISLAVVPDPGTAADPWPADTFLRMPNKVGMSTMDRYNQVTPVAYVPVLGREGSSKKKGETIVFGFRYSLQDASWFSVFQHVAQDIYRFGDLLEIQRQKYSLSDRLQRLQIFLNEDERSLWKTWKHGELMIGANGAKNADIGAMLMLAGNARHTTMKAHMPFVRNYKIAQQQMSPGFFQGAATGEYPVEFGQIKGRNDWSFASEVGNWVEPIYTTYYTLMDLGNMLLHTPDDTLLKTRVRVAADKLIQWQHEDGSWDVGYDKVSHRPSFPDLKDYRPTWYGLLVAHRILGDARYLQAARKGADWLNEEGVNKGYYLGVCGDARNIWDFATAQCAQAFLELFELTGEKAYKNAAIEAARVFATTIFTHPVASSQPKKVMNKLFEDWEINQTGLSVEHINGTASGGGPILISSFTGLFLRIYQLTGETLFLQMARGAARGRQAFDDPVSGQAIYYWINVTDPGKGAREFPHHALWQVGWITDYLLSEIHLRSEGKINFPKGFMTPKVGPHVAYGAGDGTIMGQKAGLYVPAGLVSCDNPNFEYITAWNEQTRKLYIMVLNQGTSPQQGALRLEASRLPDGDSPWKPGVVLAGGPVRSDREKKEITFTMPAWGLQVISIDFEKKPVIKRRK